jgi:hypothetical protein
MSFRKILAAVLFFTALCVPLSAQFSKEELQDLYVDYLRTEGYVPRIDKDGDIEFKIQGKTYYVIVNDGDLEYFELLFPNIKTINSDQERRQIVTAASYANRRTKVAKVYITSNENNVSITAATFIEDPADFKQFFTRLLSTIDRASENFTEQMRN